MIALSTGGTSSVRITDALVRGGRLVCRSHGRRRTGVSTLALVVVPGVGIDPAAGLVLERQVQLVGPPRGDHVAYEDRAVGLGNDGPLAIAVLHAHGHALELPSVLQEHVALDALIDDGVDRQLDAFRPLPDRHTKVEALAGLEPPVDESRLGFALPVVLG